MRKNLVAIASFLALLLSGCTIGSMGPDGSLSRDKAIADGVIPKERIVLFQRAVWLPVGATVGKLGAFVIADQMIYFILWDDTGQKYRRAWTVERSKIVDVSIEPVGISKWAHIFYTDGYYTVFAVPGDGTAIPNNDATEEFSTVLISTISEKR